MYVRATGNGQVPKVPEFLLLSLLFWPLVACLIESSCFKEFTQVVHGFLGFFRIFCISCYKN